MCSSKDKKIASPDTQEEKSLFQDAVDGVKPLQQQKVAPFRHKPAARPLRPQGPELPDRDDFFSDSAEMNSSDAINEQLLFSRPGLQRATLKKLRRGQIRSEAELDLHGYTVAEARIELTEFIHFAMGNGLRCLRIIHGKGKGSQTSKPVLKQRVNHWLRQHDEVLAFCSATGRDGGTGAIYLLLRRGER